MSITAQDVVDRVRAIYGDKSKTQILDEDIFRWITDAQRWLVRKYEPNTDSTLMSISGTSQYPTNFMLVRDVKYDGIELDATTREQLNQLDRYWQSTINTASGTPQLYWLEENMLRLYPTPSDSGKNILVTAVIAPAPVAALTDVLAIPDSYLETIVQKALQRAKEFDEDWNGAMYFKSEAKEQASEDAAMEWSKASGSYPVVRDAAGENW